MTSDRFKPAPFPLNESERLAALQRLDILDTPAEQAFDDLAALAAQLCDTPIALVSLVDGARQWFKARHGIDVAETGRQESFCAHAILGDDILEIPDTREDDRFADNPLVTGAPNIRFYAGAPLEGRDGHRYGSLCVIDTRPRRLTDAQRQGLARLARLVIHHMESRIERLEAMTNTSTLQALLEHMPDAVVFCDKDLSHHQFNGIAREWTGVDPQTLPRAEWQDYFTVCLTDGETPLPREELPILRALRGETVRQQETVIRARGQPPRAVISNGIQLKGPDGEIRGALVVMHDITELRETANRLQKERFHLATVLEGTHAGTWEWNVQTGEAICNERWANILGYQLAEIRGMDVSGWMAMIHPEDLEKSAAQRSEHLSGKAPFFDTVFRMRHKEGHWVWVHSRGRVYERDTTGNPLWMAGTHLDVSAIKAAEADIAAAQAYLQAVIDASLDVAIIATDTDGIITLFNPGAEQLLGYKAAEMLHRQTPMAFHLEEEVIARGLALSAERNQPIAGFEVFIAHAREGVSDRRQWTYVRKDGQHRQVSLSVSSLHDAAGTIIGYLGMAIDQTDQIAAEEEASLAAERFAGAFNSTAVGMALVSLEGRWLEVNDALSEMFGYSREELLPLDFQTLTHPDDLDADLALLGQVLAGDIPNYQMEKRYFRKDGTLIWAKLWVSLVRDRRGNPLHFVSQIRNITEERLAHQALERSETRLRGLFELSPIGIALIDLETGDYLDLNDSLLAPTGYTREQFVKLSYWDITPRKYMTQEHQAMQTLRKTGRYGPYEKEYTRKDGSHYPVVVQGILMTDASGRDVVWTLVEDISERKRLMRLKNEFVSTVSHELRTPLTSISGALGLVVGGALGEVPAEMQEMLQIAANNSQRLGQLVNDLLDMDKLLAGKMELKMATVDLAPVLTEAVKGMTAYAGSHGVTIRQSGDTALRLHVDPARLIQVLNNLLSNACKHSPPKSEVELHCEEGPENSVIISVIDYGSGIPQAFRPRIFQKFAQADGSDSRAQGGTGLGLAICRELVEQMGGVIGYESEEGKGSHFWLRMPRAKPSSSRKHGALTILHVEDDVDFARVVEAQLNNVAMVHKATNLADANALLRRHHFDIILLDLYLPDGRGERLWESLHLAQPTVPIVVLSGHEVPRALASRVAAVLTKGDYSADQLSDTLLGIFDDGDNPE